MAFLYQSQRRRSISQILVLAMACRLVAGQAAGNETGNNVNNTGVAVANANGTVAGASGVESSSSLSTSTSTASPPPVSSRTIESSSSTAVSSSTVPPPITTSSSSIVITSSVVPPPTRSTVVVVTTRVITRAPSRSTNTPASPKKPTNSVAVGPPTLRTVPQGPANSPAPAPPANQQPLQGSGQITLDAASQSSSSAASSSSSSSDLSSPTNSGTLSNPADSSSTFPGLSSSSASSPSSNQVTNTPLAAPALSLGTIMGIVAGCVLVICGSVYMLHKRQESSDTNSEVGSLNHAKAAESSAADSTRTLSYYDNEDAENYSAYLNNYSATTNNYLKSDNIDDTASDNPFQQQQQQQNTPRTANRQSSYIPSNFSIINSLNGNNAEDINFESNQARRPLSSISEQTSYATPPPPPPLKSSYNLRDQEQDFMHRESLISVSTGFSETLPEGTHMSYLAADSSSYDHLLMEESVVVPAPPFAHMIGQGREQPYHSSPSTSSYSTIKLEKTPYDPTKAAPIPSSLGGLGSSSTPDASLFRKVRTPSVKRGTSSVFKSSPLRK